VPAPLTPAAPRAGLQWGDGPHASHAQIVQGAGDTLPTLLQDMGVDHRGSHIGVVRGGAEWCGYPSPVAANGMANEWRKVNGR